MLDVQRLAILREFALQGTVTRTAAQLNFTPSAVSQQLAQLQHEAGVQLFRRVGRRLELTDAGTLLAERGDQVLAQLGAIEAELAAHAATVSGTVRVAAFQTAAHHLVLPVIESLAHRHPELEVELIEAEAEESLPALERREVDVVVGEEYANAPRPRSAGVVRRDILRDKLVIALPAGTRVKRSGVTLSSLASMGWVTARAGTSYAEMVTGLCRAVGGFEPDIRHRANDLQLMLEAVARMGVAAIAPALGRPGDHPGVITARIADGDHARTIFVASRPSDAARPSTAAVVGALSRPL
jgi:DNA-binding transcriptional LysR family regulator